MKGLYKTTIVIWSDFNPERFELNELAQKACTGNCYCSKQEIDYINDSANDVDWDGTEFFHSPDDDDED